jgi:serine/threonine protein kinase, bacterial
MALASGATFAGYIVSRRLGSGATGAVYLVQDPRSVRWRALKVLSPAMSDDAEFRRRFRAETPLAANLRHPNIVEVHERGEFEGQLYVVMEYVEGINAARLMADRFPAVSPAGEALAIMTAVAAALDHAHQRGLLHRDVKPANILSVGRVEGEQRVVLTDFGIARQIGEPSGTAGRHVPVGTVAYAAPEQLTGADIDGRADQYALAATAFHLLTGAPPVAYSDPVAAADHLLNNAPPKLSDQRPELAHLDGVFARALARTPADRFGSCREFAEAANERAGVAIGDRSPESVLVAEFPGYTWPEIDDADDLGPPATVTPTARKPATPRHGPKHAALEPTEPTVPNVVRRVNDLPAARAPVTRVPAATPPSRRRPRKTLLAAAALVLLGGMLAVGFVVVRKANMTGRAGTEAAASPAAAVPVAPTSNAPFVAPAPLDGTYRVEVQRAKQTFNYTPDPQAPDMDTWLDVRTSCTPTSCTAVGVPLDDGDHTQAKSAGAAPVVFDFIDGRWLSRPENTTFPCVGSNGTQGTHATTQVLSLRPQPPGGLVGEMTVTVQSNECGQQGAVVRAPAVADRTGDPPPDVAVPDPATLPGDTAVPTSELPGPPR